ncbi:hypothetical protein P7D52_04485 [Enterococcus dongliensis]|uniref:Uncharacterized protein n=1 Tax=Enterococcus dongliensis TaxID=2559925 RepID=A0AAP5KPB3_9ENTE|nr:hypothetical protein [Enterococcus dongliensis]MDT2595981.1 hypothetical protein [Enterococcus dongliensis]MDT2603403.1 hypothetical protein [Enterococcus dongliensis]MDT2634319.1 hypothetical protein [Enterococcus dongliensis]MDT2636836.1 hypothetical protein [Enterococcus dongliensis]MDT2642070.1 hypothetical protein [Enterococcus dongliensis]
MEIALIGLIGVLIGAGLTGIAVFAVFKHLDSRHYRARELEHQVKEIETINLLNKKINEILSKRNILMQDYVAFNSFDDCYITIDDFIYLNSFTAQNSFYLPNYLIEEFFKNISHRKVILSPEETVKIGGFTYKGGRIVMETFSEQLLEILNEKRQQLSRSTERPLRYFKIQ